MSLRNKTLWSVLSQSVSAACNLFWFVFVSRTFGPEEIGQYVVAVGIYSLVYTFTNLSPQIYLTRAQDCDDELKRNCQGAALVSLGFATLFLLIAALVAEQMSMTLIVSLLLILILKSTVLAFDVLPQGIFSRHELFKQLAISSTITSVLNIVMTVFLVERFKNLECLAYAQVGSALVGVAMANYFAWKHTVIGLSFSRFSDIFKFARQMLSVNGISFGAQKASDLLVGTLLGFATLGVYSRAVQISETVFQNVYAALTRVAFSRMCNDYRNEGNCDQSYNMFRELAFVVVGPILINLAILSFPIVSLVLGERWVEASGPLKVLLIAQLLIILYGMNWEVLVLNNQLHVMTRYESMKSIILLVGIFIGSYISIVFVAMGRLAESSFGYFAYKKKIGELMGQKNILFSKSAIFPILASIIPSLAYVLSPIEFQMDLIRLLVTLSLSVMFWALTLWFDTKSVFRRMSHVY